MFLDLEGDEPGAAEGTRKAEGEQHAIPLAGVRAPPNSADRHTIVCEILTFIS
jgi:hypothetical protein